MALFYLRSHSHVQGIHGYIKNRLFLHTQLYKISSKYYFNTYFIGQDYWYEQVLDTCPICVSDAFTDSYTGSLSMHLIAYIG